MARILMAAAGKTIKIAWIKAHVGIPGNEKADEAARRGAGMEEGTRVTPNAEIITVAQTLSKRKASWRRKAWGDGLPLTWSRKACSAYTRLRTGRGNIGSWRSRIGTGAIECSRCGEDEMVGEHRVFWCEATVRPKRTPEGEGTDREWISWKEVESWARSKNEGMEVEKFFEEAGG